MGAMGAAAALLVGEHDFRNFCKIDPSVTNFRRSVLSAVIQVSDCVRACVRACVREVLSVTQFRLSVLLAAIKPA